MEPTQLNWITNFIWGIADDVLRDLYVRGKYRDVILPMTVLRRLDAVLEPTKPAVLEMKAALDRRGIVNQDAALRSVAGRPFYNASKFRLLKGEKDVGEHIVGGPEYSTLSRDAFPSMKFDFMLSNPPYGKSWKSDQERMGGRGDIRDRRFVIQHAGDPEYSLITRSSDGQRLFLANMASKMKRSTPLGSRIAEVHNGLSLFTGDAGQGESNIRRWIIENDWLEAIVALPLNMFYKTGIATYIWVVSSDKPAHRRGKVQLIDATGWFKPLRKNLGQKNCELAEEDIGCICDAFRTFEETGQSKIFPNQAFGYWKVTVERPLRLAMDLTDPNWARFRAMCAEADEELVADLADRLARRLGPGPHTDYNAFMAFVEDDAGRHGLKLTPKRVRLLRDGLARRDENAAPVKTKRGEVEPDPELRDTEQIPLLEPGGIDGFIRREVLPYAPDAWVDPEATKIGYEISFNRYFYKPQPMRSLEEIRADILALERETDGLLGEILGGTS